MESRRTDNWPYNEERYDYPDSLPSYDGHRSPIVDQDTRATNTVQEDLSEEQLERVVEKLLARLSRGTNDLRWASGDASASHSGVSDLGVVGNKTTSGDVLEFFDPDAQDACIDRWLTRIDQLGNIQGWSDLERSLHMQTKLKGRAKHWISKLDCREHSWKDWKAILRTAFPRTHDFLSMLEKMLKRKKLSSEWFTTYYYAKVRLCEDVNITGENATSCIIGGLPEEVRGSVLAYGCKGLNELLNCLKMLDRYHSEEIEKQFSERNSSMPHNTLFPEHDINHTRQLMQPERDNPQEKSLSREATRIRQIPERDSHRRDMDIDERRQLVRPDSIQERQLYPESSSHERRFDTSRERRLASGSDRDRHLLSDSHRSESRRLLAERDTDRHKRLFSERDVAHDRHLIPSRNQDRDDRILPNRSQERDDRILPNRSQERDERMLSNRKQDRDERLLSTREPDRSAHLVRPKQDNTPKRTIAETLFQRAEPSESKKRHIRCFNCQEYGTHYGRECTKPKVLRCRKCGREGHHGPDCRGSKRREESSQDDRGSHKKWK